LPPYRRLPCSHVVTSRPHPWSWTTGSSRRAVTSEADGIIPVAHAIFTKHLCCSTSLLIGFHLRRPRLQQRCSGALRPSAAPLRCPCPLSPPAAHSNLSWATDIPSGRGWSWGSVSRPGDYLPDFVSCSWSDRQWWLLVIHA
jgi:hypothetical protein